ncbi:MAG: biotin transporter BioY [Peptostreptococcaceae bacterium]
MSTKNLIICSLFASITSILAQISIPFPGGVPLTMQTLAVLLTGVILGSKKGFISQCIYILLGTIGMPVFANFSGGIQSIIGPTGGFILSFPIMAFIIGFICERYNNKFIIFGAMVIGCIVNYIAGTIQFSIVTNLPIIASFLRCVAPFILMDIIKITLSTIIGIKLTQNKSIQGVLN